MLKNKVKMYNFNLLGEVSYFPSIVIVVGSKYVVSGISGETGKMVMHIQTKRK